MPDTLDLARLEKLRERTRGWRLNTERARLSVPLGELRSALSRISELESALRPFSEAADFYDDCEQHPGGCPDNAPAGELVDLTVGDFREARRAIGRKA